MHCCSTDVVSGILGRCRPSLLFLLIFISLTSSVAPSFAGGGRPHSPVHGPQGVLLGSVLVADSTADVVLRLSDADGSGAVEPGEVGTFYDDASVGPDLSVPSHLAIGADGAVYLLDGGTVDAVLRLDDLNGDDDANDAPEQAVFYAGAGGGPKLFTPNTIVSAPGGAFFISDDGANGKRIVRIQDLNGDGTAEDEGEQEVVYDAAALSVPFAEDIEALALTSEGLLAADSTLQSVFLLQDLDGDRKFMSLREQTPFLDTTGAVAQTDMDTIVVVDGVVYVADEDSGTILSARDADGDGRIGPAEWRVYLDSSTTPRVSDINDFIAAPAGGFLVLDGIEDTVWYVFDDDCSGSIDDGESRRWLLDEGGALATPSAVAFVPLDRSAEPFIRGDVNEDGVLDIADVTAGLGHLFLGEPADGCLEKLDADDSGQVDISDGVFSLNHLFQGGPPPPPPYPRPGLDPTLDALNC